MSGATLNTSARRWVATGLLAALLALGAGGLLAAPAGAQAPAAEDDRGGIVELGSPEAGRDRGSVEGELAPDGELRRAWVRRRIVENGRSEERVEEIDEERVPIAVRVQYELDGEPVDAEDLRGATGEAVVRIQLRNPTTEARTIELPDGETELDLSLPVVAEGLLELDDSWRHVRSDGGRAAPAPEGGTRLRWSAALFEPIASATSRIEVRADVDGASLPHLEVEAIPATAGSDLLERLRDRATDAGTGDAVAAFIAENLGEGLAGAAEGAEGLAGGLGQTTGGADQLNDAIREMQTRIEGGFEELEEGLTRLDAGLEGIAEALARVETGLAEIATGLEGLRDGLSEAEGGARTLAEEIAEPSEAAVLEAWDVLAEQFTVGRSDPAYGDALMAVGELHALLTGELPPQPGPGPGGDDGEEGDELDDVMGRLADLVGPNGPGAPPEGADDAPDGAAAALDDYPGLTASLEELASGLGEATEGAERLAGGLDGVADGVGEIRAGVERLRAMLAEAGGDGPDLGDGDPGEMDDSLERFAGALRELASGGGELVGGLRRLEEGGGELLDRLERELAAANLDLATVEALAEHAAQSADADDPDAVGGHDRYLLVFSQQPASATPVVALAGLLALGGTLELLRRRLTVV